MVRVQQVRVLPKRDATFRINVEDAHDFHAYRFAAISQLSTRSVKTVPPLAASVLMSTVVFGTSSNCDCNSVLIYIRRRKAGQEIPDRRLCWICHCYPFDQGVLTF